MFCRMCGRELPSEARFCSGCGAPVDPPVSRFQPKGTVRSRDLSKPIIAVLLVAILVVTACIILYDDDEVPQRTQGNVTVTGDLVRDDILIVGDGLVYDGDGAVWYVKDLHASYLVSSGDSFVERGFNPVEGRNLLPGPGEYLVTLKVDGKAIAFGSLIVKGTIVNSYMWTATLDGEARTFSLEFSFTLDEHLRYSDSDTIRWQMPTLGDSRFVQVDAPIFRLTDALADAYREVYGNGASLSDQRYADYLLSFVQCNIIYPPSVIHSNGVYVEDDEDGSADLYLYGSKEYWTYPMETLFHNQGDCEDTSFLLCSIYSAAGYDSAIATIPGHMLVGVELESFGQRVPPQGTVFTAKRIPGHECNLYFCETTYSKSVPVGYVSPSTNREVSSLDEVAFIPHHVFSPEVTG